MKRYFKSFFLFIALMALTVRIGQAQSFDYQSRPAFKFDYLKADIELKVNAEQASVQGSVTYTLQANRAGVDSLRIFAPGITVDAVLAGGKALNYSIQNGQLVVTLKEPTTMGKKYKLKIDYQAHPRFGFLKDSNGVIWSSLLPRSHRHWLPSPDHPRVETITTLTLNAPASYTVAATGVKTGEDVLGLERKKVTFRSSKPIPITSLAFAMGKLNTEGTSYGIKRIISYAESGTVSAAKQHSLVSKTKKLITQIEQATGLKYPYQRVHLVILNDHFWEQKPYGASVIYLYQNRGDWVNQLRRGLYGQWFGVYQHEAKWGQSGLTQLFQTALHYKIADKAALLTVKDVPESKLSSVYHKYSVAAWNAWQQAFKSGKSGLLKLAAPSIPKILGRGSGTFSHQRYENIWYRLTGMPQIKIPSFSIQEGEMDNGQSLYRVDYHQKNQTLKLVFTAIEKPVQSPQTVSVEIIGGGAKKIKEISFSGTKDSSSVNVPAGTQNVRLLVNKNDHINFEIHKPVPFILYQLDHGKNGWVKKRAALQLGWHTDNPDLQLALTGYLDRDFKPEVNAALLKSYAAITNGATGTQQYFLDALSSKHVVVQQAALKALQNYPDNAKVTKKLRSVIENADQRFSAKALAVYMSRMDSTKLASYANHLMQQDTAGTKAIRAIAALAKSGQTEEAVKRAKYYVEPVYAYPVRKRALAVLLKYDNSAQNWNKRVKMLLTDLDPRIRYITVQHLKSIPGIKKSAVLQKYIPVMYDARVASSVE